MRWPGMRSEYAYIPPGEDAGTTEKGQIGVSFSGHSQAVYESGGRIAESDIAPGSAIVTAGDPLRWLRVREPSESIEIYLDPEAGLPPVFAAADPVVLGVASILKRAHRALTYLSDVRASELAHLLRRHALERYGGLAVESCGGTRLPQRTLARVTDYMQSALAETLALEDLAGIARMSPFHFSRSFHRTTGLAPHAFVTMLRMERAKTLFLEGRYPVAEVAARVGFRNFSHFRRQFLKHTGFRPSELRPASHDV
jgi:AraC family transcriptional regulator